MPRTLTCFAAPLALFLAAIIIYWPGLHGEFFFDSLPNIRDNPAIQIADLKPATLLAAARSFDLSSIGRPLPMLSFALNWYLTGPDPFWFKLVNLLIHGANAVLVFFLVLRLLHLYRRLALGGAVNNIQPETAAFLAALLWAIAPIHGFTVVYAVQRMVLLGAFFTLIALHAYLSLRQSASQGATGRMIGYGTLLGLAGALSLACKETAVVIPFYIAVTEFFLLRLRELGRWRPLFLTGIWLTVLTPILALSYTVWNNPAGIHAGYQLRTFGPIERMLTEARVLLMYLRNTLVPDYGQLYFFHDNLPISHSLTDPIATAISVTILCGLAIAGLLLRRRLPLLGFAVFWFLAGHCLEASFFPLELVFWHRNYLPSLGPLLALTGGLVWLTSQPGLPRAAGVGIIAMALGLSAVQSRLIATDWSDRVAIARAEVIKNPGSARASHYYGMVATVAAEQTHDPQLVAEAHKFFLRAMAQDPRMLHPGLGLVYLALAHQEGELPPVLTELKRRAGSEMFEVSDPAVFNRLVELSKQYPDRLDRSEVLEILDAATANPRITPGQQAVTHLQKTVLLNAAGLPRDRWLPSLREAVRLQPGDPSYRSLLFRTLIDLGEIDEAAAMLSRPFSARERINEPRLVQYEAALAALLEARRTGGP